MNTHQLQIFLQNHKFFNAFVVASDKLPENFNLPVGFIINLSNSGEKGSHWVTLYINREGSGYYFDSFGFPPKNKNICTFLHKNCNELEINKLQYQQIGSRVCGKYAAVFLKFCFNHGTSKGFCKLFSKNFFINDMVITKMYLN
jgi:hypothetical protein